MKKNKLIKSLNIKERVLILLSLFLLILLFLIIYFNSFSTKAIIEEEVDEIEFVEIENETESEKKEDLSTNYLDTQLIAVILGNEPRYRPTNNLSEASLVYELPTEGGTSRFLGLFPLEADLDKVGSVRSARPYFVDLAYDNSALLVHCGGSPQALAQIASQRLTTLNEFYNAKYFWRDSNYLSPHNIMISSDLWQEFVKEKEFAFEEKNNWKFVSSSEFSGNDELRHDEVLIYYSKNYQTKWKYNEEEKYYYNPSQDFKASNLIIHYNSSYGLDDVLRLELDILGEGDALVCQLGSCHQANWEKSSREEKMTYYIDDEELTFIDGPTWISYISAGARVDY